jgi:DNA-binding NarL/FixJ family response regulator
MPYSIPECPKVAFVEDEVLLLGLLSEYFLKSGRFDVVGAYSDGLSAVEGVAARPVDLLVVDLQLPDLNGLSLVQRLGERLQRPPRIIVLSGGTNPLMVRQLLRLGVRGILQKGISAAEVLSACQRVMRGGICLELPEGDMVDLANAPVSDSSPSLTVRETEVLDLVARGRRSKEIAEALGLSVRTVEKHRENLMKKLGLHDVAGLVRYAARQGIIAEGCPTSNGGLGNERGGGGAFDDARTE